MGDRGIMRHTEILVFIVALTLTISCAGKNEAAKNDSLRYAKGSEPAETGRQAPASLHGARPDYVPGEILVRFRDGTDGQTMEAIQRDLNLRTIRVVSGPYLYLMKIPHGSSVEEMVDRLKGIGVIKYAEPNYLSTIHQ
jgi:hypothetical protein